MTRTQGSEAGSDRSIDEILARRRQRRRERIHTRAPDFLHGDCRLDAIYNRFGERWVETTAFVQRVARRDGVPVGWTVGSFEERFLTVAHGVVGEVPDPRVWMEEQLEGNVRCIELDLSNRRSNRRTFGGRELVRIETRRSRLLELERSELKALRDRDFGSASRRSERLRERLMESRIDIMSLICLCARLA